MKVEILSGGDARLGAYLKRKLLGLRSGTLPSGAVTGTLELVLHPQS
jgi:hypothetical protein